MTSHFTAELDPDAVANTVRVYRGGGIEIEPRSRTDIARLFDGMHLLEPGIVPLYRWHPDSVEASGFSDGRLPGFGAVGRK